MPIDVQEALLAEASFIPFPELAGFRRQPCGCAVGMIRDEAGDDHQVKVSCPDHKEGSA